MAFKTLRVEPVEFGDKEIEPVLDTEKKLRLQRVNFSTVDGEQRADEVLASCFPEDEAFVLDYLKKCPVLEKQRLQTYLVGGESAVRDLDEARRNAISKAMENKA